jgi:hypothetical protein
MQADHVGGGKALRHALLELRRQGDLRDQHQHLTALRERVRGEAQIDLGLAAAGDAMQQPGPETHPGTDDRVHRGGLLRRRQRLRVGFVTRAGVGHDLQPATAQQFAHRLATLPGTDHAAPPRPRLRSERLQQRERPARPPRRAKRLAALRGDAKQRILVLVTDAVGATQARRQRERHHLAERRVVIARHEGHQLQPVRRQGRHAALDVQHGLDPCEFHPRFVADTDDQPGAFTAPERHLHAAPDVSHARIRGRVIEGLRQRDRQGDADDGHGAAEAGEKIVLLQRLVRLR